MDFNQLADKIQKIDQSIFIPLESVPSDELDIEKANYYLKLINDFSELLERVFNTRPLVRPNISFISKADLEKILQTNVDDNFSYFYPRTHTIFINTDFVSQSETMPNAITNNLIVQLLNTLLYKEEKDGDKMVALIQNMRLTAPRDEDLKRIFENEGKAFLVKLPEELLIEEDEGIGDSIDSFPYIHFQTVKARELLIDIFYALYGEELLGVPINEVNLFVKKFAREGNGEILIDILSYEKDKLYTWLTAIFNFLMSPKDSFQNLREIAKKDKEFRDLMNIVLDGNRIEEGSYREFFELIDKYYEQDTISGGDLNKIEKLMVRCASIFYIGSIINGNGVYSASPIANAFHELVTTKKKI